MGREQRTESRIGGTKIQVQPTFVLVGASGTNKRKIANELAADHFTEKLAVQNEVFPAYAALGFHADYRVELRLASERATRLTGVDMPTLYTHSLIDSLAYGLARVELQVEAGITDEKWALTTALVGTMLTDTFKADEILFLMADFDLETQFEQAKIQAIQAFILDGYEMNYTIIDAEDAVDDISRVISSYIA